MAKPDSQLQFSATLLRAQRGTAPEVWGFILIPKEVSEKLPRRGRVTVEGTINSLPFSALLEPDGQKSHWLGFTEHNCAQFSLSIGDELRIGLQAAEEEPDPQVPDDLNAALIANPAALESWLTTTNIARLDWIHWVVSSKQSKTRTKRIDDACDMLSSGKKRVCCFDTSGFYSKALSAPKVEPAP